MSTRQQVFAAGPAAVDRRPPSRWHPHLHGSELGWALAFVTPYAAMVLAFAAYPILYALWLGGDFSLYAALIADPHYAKAALNTALLAGFAANTMMFVALLLSGFFMRRRGDLGFAGADPDRRHPDAPDRPARGAVVNGGGVRRRLRCRLRGILVEAGSALLGLVLLIWALLPVYNMLLIALDPDEGETEFTGIIWPDEPSLNSFRAVLTEDHWYLENFWRQFGNSFYVGLLTMVLTVLIASLASFAVGRMRLTKARALTNTALLVYAIPAALLAIPFVRLTQR